MNNALVQNKQNHVSAGFEMKPTNLSEAMEFSKIIANSDIVPKDFKGKPGNILVAIQMGQEIGLKPMQALQSIAVINGRPSIYGDAAIALAINHPDCEDIIEKIIQDPQGNHRAICIVKRKGHEPHTSEFSVEDAKKAGLWGKTGPWSSSPKRMLQMRSRSFALRNKFPDALKGLAIREEVMDFEIIKENSNQPSHQKKSDMLLEKLNSAEFIENNIIEDEQFVDSQNDIIDEPQEFEVDQNNTMKYGSLTIPTVSALSNEEFNDELPI